MISHDREFLDGIIERVLHIERQAVASYAGNYSQFEIKRSEELAAQATLHAQQERRIAEITRFVARFRASATKSRQAQSRLKTLERMERIAPAHVDSPFQFEFAAPWKTPRPLLTLEAAVCGYDATPLLRPVSLSLGPTDRIALLGPNGAGKSTLVRLLAGADEPLSGQRRAAPDLAVGYFAQQQLEQLQLDCDAAWHLRQHGGTAFAAAGEQAVRDHLGRFGFTGARAFEPVARFSGGEKARLTLALIVARRPNLLLLDEPTNHLDIEMREALAEALQGFEGGMLVVSHDRYLIKSVCDTLWLVANGALQPFDGDLDDYQAWLQAHNQPRAADAPRTAHKPRSAKRSDPRERLQERLARIEADLESLLAQRRRLERDLAAQPASAALQAQLANLQRDVAVLEAAWVEVGTTLEAAQS